MTETASPRPPQLGLYVHWPFCTRICPYCDFNVYKDRGVDEAAWRDALLADLAHWAGAVSGRQLESVYFGGGTPSLAPPSLVEGVIEEAERLFGFASAPEITLEANPNDLDPERAGAFLSAGVNRLSLGIQSFRDSALKFLGRNHDAAEARRAIALALETFPAATFDLIYGRPDQTLDDWRRELDEALAFGATHLSLYQLTIEPGTAFAKAVAAGRWRPADEDACAAQYELAQDMTGAAGLAAYEVSNHARSGAQSRHNLLYWRYQDYIGVGPGAHGRLTTETGRIATRTHDRPADYLRAVADKGTGATLVEKLDEEAMLIERLSMGLRLAEGIPLYADDVFYRDDSRAEKLHEFIDRGFLTLQCGTLRASKSGRRVLNRLLYELLG